MRSIRRGISSSCRTAPSRYNSGSYASPTLVTDNSTSWKGKDKDTSIAREAHKGCNQNESASGLQADSEPVLSEFEAIARRYDDDEEDHPVVENQQRKLWVDNGPPKRLAYLKRIFETGRLPPIPSCSWGYPPFVRDRHKYNWAFPSNNVPVPLTYGSGGTERRVLRYQQARKDRQTILRGVVDTLNKSEEVQESFRSDGRPPVVPFPRREPLSQSSGTVSRTHQPHHWSRGYSSSADTSGSTNAQPHPFTDGVPVSDSATQAEQDSRATLKNVTTKSETSNEENPSSKGEVSTEWPREKWQSDWGTDQLAPPVDSRFHGRSLLSNYPPTIPSSVTIDPDYPLSQVEVRSVRYRSMRTKELKSPKPPKPPKFDLERDATSTDVPNHEHPPHLAEVSLPKTKKDKSLLLRLHDALRLKKEAPLPLDAVDTKPIEKTPLQLDDADTKTLAARLSERAKKRTDLALRAKVKREFLAGSRSPFTRRRKGIIRERPAVAPRQQKEPSHSTVKGILEPLHSDAEVLEDVQPPTERRPVPRLAHGLDRVLFNPSVHWIQDPHSRVYNFSPTLQSLPAVTEFAFERLGSYIRSSHDKSLRELAQQHRKRFVGSTSSLTGFLSHIYFLISGNRSVDTSTLSMAFKDEARSFTPGIRMPAEMVFHHKVHNVEEDKPTISTSDEDQIDRPSNSTEQLGTSEIAQSSKTVISENESKSGEMIDIYALDGGSDDPDKRKEAETNVLLWLGTMAEKFLTLPEPAFTALLRKNPVNESLIETPRAESYRYAKSSQFVMRAQLDCQDTRLPGTGVFDIKTRAVLPIRIDRLNYQANSGYLIRKMTGLFESFEREYYDLIRSAFLKYNFQARIGNMDGVFVAYHNTARMFGFQYVPIAEMEQRLYGPGHPDRGARIFEKCIGLLEAISSEIVACFPKQTVLCTAETRKDSSNLKIWVTPSSRPADKAIEQLTVTVRHTIAGRPASSEEAIDNAHREWKLDYTITKSARPKRELWSTLELVNARKFPSALPEGVSQEEMERRIAHVNFGVGKGFDQELPEDLPAPQVEIGPKSTKKYSKVDRRLNFLRQLAKRGWEDIKQESESGGGRIVFGVDADEGAIPDADKQPIIPDQTVMPEGATFVSDDALNAGGSDTESIEQDDTSSQSTQTVIETPSADSTASDAASSDTSNVLKSYAHYHL